MTPSYIFKRNWHLGGGLTDLNLGADLSLKMKVSDFQTKVALYTCVEEHVGFWARLMRRFFKNLITDYFLNVHDVAGNLQYRIEKPSTESVVTVFSGSRRDLKLFEFKEKIDGSGTIGVFEGGVEKGLIKEYLLSWHFDLLDTKKVRVGRVSLPGVFNKFFPYQYRLYLSQKSEREWAFFAPFAVELLVNKSR